jgi:cytochrome bd-type quinol oxidase subunit 2
MHFLLPFFRWSDSTWLGETIRGSRIYFPIIETFHLLALTILFGAVLVLNLRLCGLMMKAQPTQQVARDLAPWAAWSLVVILVSGAMLFLSEAMKCYASKPFQVKMVFLFLALIYHFTIHRGVSRSNREPHRAFGVIVGAVNVLLWLGVGLGGRGIGFL